MQEYHTPQRPPPTYEGHSDRDANQQPASQPKPSIVANGRADRVEREKHLPPRVAPILVRQPSHEERGMRCIGYSRVAENYQWARHLTKTRTVLAFIVGTLNFYFAVRRQEGSLLHIYGAVGIAFGYTNVVSHFFDSRHEMRSPTNPKPKIFLMVRFGFFLAGWIALSAMALFIVIIGLDPRSGRSLSLRQESLDGLNQLEPRKTGGTGSTPRIPSGVPFSDPERLLLFTNVTLSLICVLLCIAIGYFFYRLCVSDFTEEKRAMHEEMTSRNLASDEQVREGAV